MNKPRLTAALLTLLLLAAPLAGVLGETAAPQESPGAMETAAPEETAEAPEAAETAEPAEESAAGDHFFAAMKLTYLDGTPYDTSVFIGKPILLNIWATWCGPCVQELPHLNELAEEYRDKITIVALHSEGLTVTPEGGVEPNGETNAAAVKLQQDLGLTLPMVNPDITMLVLMNDPQYQLQVSVLPTTWLIDGEGYIRAVIEASNTKEGWQGVIDKFLADMQEEADGKTGG